LCDAVVLQSRAATEEAPRGAGKAIEND
jgi:hypothetical protein